MYIIYVFSHKKGIQDDSRPQVSVKTRSISRCLDRFLMILIHHVSSRANMSRMGRALAIGGLKALSQPTPLRLDVHGKSGLLV